MRSHSNYKESRLLGPIFSREASITPKRGRHFLFRAIYVGSFAVLMCTAWMLVAGTQQILAPGDMARFGAALFRILAPLQLALLLFLSALGAASAISQEKDRRTLILLLLTRMSNAELVLGKLFSSLLNVLILALAALPFFMAITLFGGIAPEQVYRVFLVTLVSVLVAGSVGSMMAFWREKTFQALALTALSIVIWISCWEGVLAIMGTGTTLGQIASACSPIRALLSAAHPLVPHGGILERADVVYILTMLGLSLALNAITTLRVRVWNPSREVRPGQQEDEATGDIWGNETSAEETASESAAQGEEADEDERARAGHVDSIGRAKTTTSKTREVWDNPILWRETMTRAYGRKIIVIKAAYVLFAVMAFSMMIQSADVDIRGVGLQSVIPSATYSLGPFFLISLVLINALAVTSITNERDGQALDLLLATDISPKEFVFGKLGGVFWVTKEAVILPLLACIVLFSIGGMKGEDLCFLVLILLVMYIFANALGVHCGMTYANSRSAIGVSLAAIFFLFLGVVTCVAVMISFSGSFERQLPAFLAFSLGGSVGLYVTLGLRNPSRAMFWAAIMLPFATFYSVTSLLIDQNLPAFVVTSSVYGFTALAMLVPAIGEFDFAMGRTKGA